MQRLDEFGVKKQPLHKYVSKHFERKATEISYMTYWQGQNISTHAHFSIWGMNCHMKSSQAAVMHEMKPETFGSVIKGMIYSI